MQITKQVKQGFADIYAPNSQIHTLRLVHAINLLFSFESFHCTHCTPFHMQQTENKQIISRQCPFINIDFVPLSYVCDIIFKLCIRRTHHFDSINLLSFSSKATLFVNNVTRVLYGRRCG